MEKINENIENLEWHTDQQYPMNSGQSTIKFLADVEFGRPSKDCINFGICRINPTSETLENISKLHCHKPSVFKGEIDYHDSSKFEMTFSKDQLGMSCREKYFSTEYFRVDEYFSTSFQPKNLEIRFMEIKKGKYLITKTDTTFTIIFS